MLRIKSVVRYGQVDEAVQVYDELEGYTLKHQAFAEMFHNNRLDIFTALLARDGVAAHTEFLRDDLDDNSILTSISNAAPFIKTMLSFPSGLDVIMGVDPVKYVKAPLVDILIRRAQLSSILLLDAAGAAWTAEHLELAKTYKFDDMAAIFRSSTV